MCGITGFIDYHHSTSPEVLIAMADSLQHRGPDDSGYEIVKINNAGAGLGFRRLSIIDLSSAGHQPMFSIDKKKCIVFNGEIYNYRELRSELEKSGELFVSGSDTEVILKSYEKYGMECLHRFNGMFAFALFDLDKQKLFLCRDRAGVKPLFYYWHNGLFLFASELKALHRHSGFKKEINPDALALYFQRLCIPAPYCIFKNTYKLEPGHWLEFDIGSKELKTHCYWTINTLSFQGSEDISPGEVETKTEILLASAFEYRLVSDVPVGVFLSGGYDSTALAALLQKNSAKKIHTFTIGFTENEFDEAPYAKKVAGHLGTYHEEYYCSHKEALSIIPELPIIWDEPFADSSAVPTVLVSRMAHQHVKVALSADGGDELFAGYGRYPHSLHHISRFNKWPLFIRNISGYFLSKFSHKIIPDLSQPDLRQKLYNALRTKSHVQLFDVINQIMTPEETARLMKVPFSRLKTKYDEKYADKDILSTLLTADYQTYLVDDILQKVDRATMSAGLEGREPFLDYRLAEWVSQIPSSYKLRNGSGKFLLKKIVHKYVPENLMNRPKMGFSVPVEQWCKNELKDLMTDYLSEHTLSDQSFLNEEAVAGILKDYFKGKQVDFQRIWAILMFVMWYRKWM